MPNHVRTMIKFKNLKPDDIDNIIKLCTVPVTYDSSERKVGSPMDYPAIDFDKIIPEPRTIEDCDPRFVFSKEKIESGHTGVEYGLTGTTGMLSIGARNGEHTTVTLKLVNHIFNFVSQQHGVLRIQLFNVWQC